MFARPLKIAATATFAILLLVAAGVGAALGTMQTDSAAHLSLAETVTRDLSRSWRFGDIRTAFVDQLDRQIDEREAQRAFQHLSHLGAQRDVSNIQQTAYRIRYVTGDGVVRRSEITFTARYEHGTADISVTVVTTSGVTRVQHLHIKPHAPPTPPPQRQLASHAETSENPGNCSA